MKRILITGGAGFVGSSLARAFRESSPTCEVIAFDNLKRRGSELNLRDFRQRGIRFVHGDVRNPGDLAALEGTFDLVIEASAEPSVHAGLGGGTDYLIGTNLVGTVHCLEHARRAAGGVIFLSTSRVYSLEPLRALPLRSETTRFVLDAILPGASALGIAENFPTHLPRSLYGGSKLASEILFQEFVAAFGLRAIVNRCGVIAGPGQFGKVDQGVFTLWVAHHLFGQPLRYTGFEGRGQQIRDLLHPDDLFALILRQADRLVAQSGGVFNVGGGPAGAVSLREYTALCQMEIRGENRFLTESGGSGILCRMCC